jgi:hypothetical protein
MIPYHFLPEGVDVDAELHQQTYYYFLSHMHTHETLLFGEELNFSRGWHQPEHTH